MPQFVIDCSEGVLCERTAIEIMHAVFATAKDSGLFLEHDIRVRIRPFTHYLSAKPEEGFLHVFGYIMEGRSESQRADLSKAVIGRLKDMLPSISVLSMDIAEFKKATYCNKLLLGF